MQLVTRLSAGISAMQLRRQFRGIEKVLVDLQPNARRQLAAIAMREFQNASKSEFPHLYATPPDHKYHPWGTGTEIGLERMRSDSLQVRLRGVALWLTVAYHETKDSQFPEQQEMHRQVMRAMRALKDSIPAAELNNWFAAANEAQAA